MKFGAPVISAEFGGPVFSDCRTASEIIKVCDKLADKLEVLEKLFAVPERIELICVTVCESQPIRRSYRGSPLQCTLEARCQERIRS